MTDRPNRGETPSSAQKDRKSRLASALKANIARRKAQARDRATQEPSQAPPVQEQDKER